MEALEKEAIVIIRNWSHFTDRIRSIELTLKEHYFPLTNKISLVPPCQTNVKVSKIETFTLQHLKYKERYENLVKEKELYLSVFETTDLSDIERELIIYMSNGITPLNYARMIDFEPIFKIYQIQYSAVKKLVKRYNELTVNDYGAEKIKN